MRILKIGLKILSGLGFLTLLVSYAAPFFHPDTLGILPFLGLGYPITLAGNLLLVLIWAILRDRWFFYGLTVLLIGGTLHFRFFSTTLFSDEKGENELKVMSYNVRLFDVYNPDFELGKATREQQFSYIRRIMPDVLCVQEYYKQDAPSRYVTVDSIFQIMGTNFYHERSAHKRKTRQNFGVAMFSKYPMIAKGDVMFDTQSSYDYNYCIYADIVKEQDTFRVYNVHLQSIQLQSNYYNDDPDDPMLNLTEETGLRYIFRKLRRAFSKRAGQARRVVEHIQTSPYPTIVCGDFNDTPLSYAYNQFNRTLIDAFRNCRFGIGATYIGKLPAGRIDYIFHSNDLHSTDFEIQTEELSDHRAIYCTISK
ncbi:MAG: hypothetical protein RL264_53 [Bacteroidota bacterium]